MFLDGLLDPVSPVMYFYVGPSMEFMKDAGLSKFRSGMWVRGLKRWGIGRWGYRK